MSRSGKTVDGVSGDERYEASEGGKSDQGTSNGERKMVESSQIRCTENIL